MTERPKSSDEQSSATESIVIVVEDDAAMRRALSNLFPSVGLQVAAFGAASDMLQSNLPDVASCLVLDVRLPGLSGLDFQTELAKANIRIPIPIIFMTGHGDIPMSVRAMKGGAVDFLTKPFRDQDMLDAVVTAIERDRKQRTADRIVLICGFETLSTREREVLALVSSGMMNKQIAAELGLAEITVKIHRGRIMKKMGAKSLADLLERPKRSELNAARPNRRMEAGFQFPERSETYLITDQVVEDTNLSMILEFYDAD